MRRVQEPDAATRKRPAVPKTVTDGKENPYRPPDARLVDTPQAASIERPWRTLLIWPRKTFRSLARSPLPGWTIPLAALHGVSRMLEEAWREGGSLANYFSWHRWMLLAVPAGIAFGVVALYLYAAVVSICARFLGGTGSAGVSRVALAWSYLPLAPYIAVQIAAYLRLEDEIFGVVQPLQWGMDRPLAILIGAKVIASVWSVAIFAAGISVFHRMHLASAFIAILAGAVGLWAASLALISVGIWIFDFVVEFQRT